MTRRLALLATGALLFGACGVFDSVATPDPDEVVLQLRLDGCRHGVGNRATAVPVGNGLALTVAHAFDDVEGFTVVDPAGNEFETEVLHLDRDRDIAVLAIPDNVASPSVERGLQLGPRTDDTTVRLALHRNDGPSVTDIEILRRVKVSLDGVGRRDGMEVTGEILPGDSGGPVIDDDGRVIGLVFASARGDERGWAVAASELQRAVDQIGAPIPIACNDDPIE